MFASAGIRSSGSGSLGMFSAMVWIVLFTTVSDSAWGVAGGGGGSVVLTYGYTGTQYITVQGFVDRHQGTHTQVVVDADDLEGQWPEAEWHVALDGFGGTQTSVIVDWDALGTDRYLFNVYVTLEPGWMPPEVTSIHETWGHLLNVDNKYANLATAMDMMDFSGQLGVIAAIRIVSLRVAFNAVPTVTLSDDGEDQWPQGGTVHFTAEGHDVETDAYVATRPDSNQRLQYRWDWNGDGSWDTDWDYRNVVSHVFMSEGPTTVMVEVSDRKYEALFGEQEQSEQAWTASLTRDVVRLVGNTPPTAPTSIARSILSNPYGAPTLRATASGAFDIDGDPLTYQYEWRVSSDGGTSWSEWDFFSESTDFTTSFIRGQIWQAHARAHDGTVAGDWGSPSGNYYIFNAYPTAPMSVTVLPAAPVASEPLSATADGSTDYDGDSFSYVFQWCSSTDGTNWNPWGFDGGTLPGGTTSRGERWKARGRAVDTFGGNSLWTESPPVTIGNAAAPTVTGTDPSSAANGAPASVTITGTGFQAGATATLQKADAEDIAAAALTVVSETGITCTFDITGATVGLWDVTVTNTDGQSGTLSDGFEVVAADVSPPDITGWWAVATHGGAVGELATPIADGYCEARVGAMACLSVSFTEPVDAATVTPASVTITGATGGDKSSLVQSIALQGDGSIVRITLSGPLPEPDRYTIALGGEISDTSGNAIGGNRSLSVVCLHGDVNANGSVDVGDMLAVRSQFGAPVVAGNCRYDVNTNGTIDIGDMLAVRARFGHRAP